MSSPDYLRSRRDSYAVALHGMLRDYERDNALLFLLVEGKDGDYYRPRISAILSSKATRTSFRNLRGKKNLKLLVEAVRRNLKLQDAQFIAFFDRDYEHDLTEIAGSRSFITVGYSVENYYTSEAVFREAVQSLLFADVIHADDDISLVDYLAAKFSFVQRQYHCAVHLFNCWAWVQRHIPRPGKLVLDDFVIDRYVSLKYDEHKAEGLYTLKDLNELAPDRLPVSSDEICQAADWFAQRNPRESYRGKQEMDFLYWYLSATIERAAYARPPFTKSIRCSKRVSRKEMLSELSSYAHTPAELNEFLASFTTETSL